MASDRLSTAEKPSLHSDAIRSGLISEGTSSCQIQLMKKEHHISAVKNHDKVVRVMADSDRAKTDEQNKNPEKNDFKANLNRLVALKDADNPDEVYDDKKKDYDSNRNAPLEFRSDAAIMTEVNNVERQIDHIDDILDSRDETLIPKVVYRRRPKDEDNSTLSNILPVDAYFIVDHYTKYKNTVYAIIYKYNAPREPIAPIAISVYDLRNINVVPIVNPDRSLWPRWIGDQLVFLDKSAIDSGASTTSLRENISGKGISEEDISGGDTSDEDDDYSPPRRKTVV